MNGIRGVASVVLLASSLLPGCGRTVDGAAPSEEMGGTSGAPESNGGGAAANGGDAEAGGSASDGSPGDMVEACRAPASVGDVVAAPPSALPLRLEGALCQRTDALFATFLGIADELSQGPVRVHLAEPAGEGSYTVTLFRVASDGATLLPLENAHETPTFVVDSTTPDFFFEFQKGIIADERVVVKVEGPPGPVALEIARAELSPVLNCLPAYESLPVKTPTRGLPTVIELELCSARDSRVAAIAVVENRPVSITLENPSAIDLFYLSVCRTDVAGFERLPVAVGTNEAKLGLVGHSTITFTQQHTGSVALYASFGRVRAEPLKLRVEQN